MDNKFIRIALKLNSLLHKMVNLHIFPPRNINSTNSNISSGTFKIRSYVNKHYNATECKLEGSPWESIWLFFTGRMRCIFLWNVLYISLRRSWCYSSWRLKLSRSHCLHKYFFTKVTLLYTNLLVLLLKYPKIGNNKNAMHDYVLFAGLTYGRKK